MRVRQGVISITRKKKRRPLQYYLWFKPGSDSLITLAVFMLLAGGIVMLVSTNQGANVGEIGSLVMDVVKQSAFVVLALALMIFLNHQFSYQAYDVFQWAIIVIYLALMFFTAFFGREILGSRAWLPVGSLFTIQPSEFGKEISILSIALALQQARVRHTVRQGFWSVFKVPLILMGFNTLALIAQKDFGSLIIYLGINMLCFLIPNYPGLRKGQRWIKVLILSGVVAAGVMIGSDQVNSMMARVPFLSHISVRIANVKDPYIDVYSEGYQPANSLYGMADAGLTGKGLGNSARKYGYLTQADSDYIFAIIIEETGIFGLLYITLFYALLFYRLLYFAFKAFHTSDKVLLFGTAVYFMLHFIVNIGGVGSLLPMTGVPLLLISSGGSALLASCMAIGIAQNRIAEINHRLEQRAAAEQKQTDR